METHMYSAFLFDPFLSLAADVLDDLEHTRIANENRFRQLTRGVVDKDGETRGFGLAPDHPDVKQLAALVESLGKAEHQAELNLARIMKRHPLAPWFKAERGVGPKQGPRLLASLGDPYINTVTGQPRTVAQLWRYCGLDPEEGVARHRKRGVKSNWNATAKSRAWLVADNMLRSGNRGVYDQRKAITEGRVHSHPCVRCGPSGHPALPGAPWSKGHRHNDALRLVSKDLLKRLWVESQRLHQEWESAALASPRGMAA